MKHLGSLASAAVSKPETWSRGAWVTRPPSFHYIKLLYFTRGLTIFNNGSEGLHTVTCRHMLGLILAGDF